MKWRPLITIVGGTCVFCIAVAYGQKSTEVALQTNASIQDESLRRFARSVASYELAAIHSETLIQGETPRQDSEFRAVLRTLFRDLPPLPTSTLLGNQESYDPRSSPRRKEGIDQTKVETAPPLTEFEKRALKEIGKGASEILEQHSTETLLYLRRIRPLESCVVCHGKRGSYPGEINGMTISLQITLAKVPDAIKGCPGPGNRDNRGEGRSSSSESRQPE